MCVRMPVMRIAAITVLLLLVSATAWTLSNSAKALIGSWEGESKCAVPSSPCHDEHALYQISFDRKDPDQINIDAYKVLESGPEFIGTIACHYQSRTSVLTCTANTSQKDDWRFRLEGDSLVGALTIDSGKTLYRRINLHRVEEKAK